jgi:hypothetical protein
MDSNEEIYLIWSNEHRAWWKPGRMGYTTGLRGAGRYTRQQAIAICREAIPSASHVGAVAEIPVKMKDVKDVIDGALLPTCILVDGRQTVSEFDR